MWVYVCEVSYYFALCYDAYMVSGRYHDLSIDFLDLVIFVDRIDQLEPI